ncbi:hypothetical protein I3I95_06120 [bacterium]|nr:hypothetical protein [bacterium]
MARGRQGGREAGAAGGARAARPRRLAMPWRSRGAGAPGAGRCALAAVALACAVALPAAACAGGAPGVASAKELTGSAIGTLWDEDGAIVGTSAPARPSPMTSIDDDAAASSSFDLRTAAIIPGDDLMPSEREQLGGDQGFDPADVDASQAAHVTIGRLAGADEDLDGKLVTFIGEVVGEPVSLSDDRMWVQLQATDASAILVEMSAGEASVITNWQEYGRRGTSLRVTGVYHVADQNNFGDLDVTAYDVSLIDAGGERPDALDTHLLGAAIASLLVAAAVIIVNVYVRRRQA